jgi:futalosine hydrolase
MPDVESMEGAAFMYASLIAGVPFAQVRAVSNMVERRNRGAWKIDAAITALGDRATKLLEAV